MVFDVSIVGVPGEVTGNFGGITYMDELTSEICTEAKENDTAQLMDWRDRKIYWVTKLADNNCWMTQNLDYDDPGSTKITNTSGTNGGPNSEWQSTNTVRQYWDPGEKIISGNALTAATNNTDRHLLVGNYYSWPAVTNGNTGGSICPGGWKLPTSNNTNSGSFGGLHNASGIGSTGSILTEAPYYFQYGGYVDSGKLSYTGTNGLYWSGTAYSANTAAYALLFSLSRVTPSNDNFRYLGMPVRCLVLGS